MWTTDITDSDLITEEKADFLLGEAKEQLAATVGDAESITKTGTSLVGGLLTVSTALVGIAATIFKGSMPLAAQSWITILPLVITSLYLMADATMVMWFALSVKGLDHAGNVPSNLGTQELFQLELRLIKFAEAAGYQDRIENNHRRNEAISLRINLGIKAAILSPIVYLTALAGAWLVILL